MLVLGLAPPAQAHATVLSTDPAAGAVLAEAPDTVGITFTEPVSTLPDGASVVDASGAAITSTASASGAVLSIALTGAVPDGTLVVAYRVVSEDGHPISGTLIFSVGAPSATIQEPPRTAGTTGVPPTLSLLKFLGYVGLFLAAGLAWFAALVLPADRATDSARRRLVLVGRWTAALATGAWLLALPVTASYQSGGGVRWSALALEEYAVVAAVVVGLGLGHLLLGRSPRLAVAAVAVASVAPALTGHTRAASPQALAVAADALHLLAGSVWLGGLVALALVLADLSGRGTLAGETLTRFSSVAAGVLAALTVTGTVLAWRVLGSWSGLVETTYGRLLLVKIGAGLVVVAIAAFNRWRLLPRLQDAVHRKERRSGAGLVTRAVAAEGALLVVVLLATGFLVDRNPDGDPEVQAAATARPTTRTAELDAITARATLSRQTPGPATITVELVDPAGVATEGFAAPEATLATSEVDLGAVPLRNIGPGVYEAAVVIPAAGDWSLRMALQTTADVVRETTLRFSVL